MEDEIIGPGRAAEILGVNPKTLTRWANANKIDSFKTLGGHRRFHLSVVRAVLNNR